MLETMEKKSLAPLIEGEIEEEEWLKEHIVLNLRDIFAKKAVDRYIVVLDKYLEQTEIDGGLEEDLKQLLEDLNVLRTAIKKGDKLPV